MGLGAKLRSPTDRMAVYGPRRIFLPPAAASNRRWPMKAECPRHTSPREKAFTELPVVDEHLADTYVPAPGVDSRPEGMTYR